jgi:HK97 family phage portal protein
MKLLGWELSRTSAKEMQSVTDSRGGWINLVRESFPGAWQQNVEVNRDLVTSFFAVFACMTLVASDISKLRIKVMRKEKGVWSEAEGVTNYDALLRKPNNYQNRIQFFENWILSKLLMGNVYVLKQTDNRQFVSRMTVLDPHRVKVLVSESGDVFYELQKDNVSGLRVDNITVPASSIIHDRMNCLFHPLVGLSPIYAAGLAATQGLAIQKNSSQFFSNRSIPGGIITAPTTIPDATARRLKETWDASMSGANAGKTAVLGDGLEFKSMAVNADDAQMLEMAKATAEWVCSCFHVPPYKIGVGPTPPLGNVEALNLEYYNQALQKLIEDAEICLNHGLNLDNATDFEFDTDGLLRMDTTAQINSLKEAVGASLMSPNEGRAKISLPPVKGGESPLSQQQYYSLEALAERDADKRRQAISPHRKSQRKKRSAGQQHS